MTKLTEAMAELLARVPDGDAASFPPSRYHTLDALVARGLVERIVIYRRTPFGRETAARLARLARLARGER